jgi:hypothetical protein
MTAPADFATYMTAAQTAFAAADYVTARQQVILAGMSLAQMPNAGSDSTNISYRQDEVSRLLAAINDEISRATSMTIGLYEGVQG